MKNTFPFTLKKINTFGAMNVIPTASNYFLGASLILVPLGKRLGIATVLGYLFTGILLGPSVLNIAHDPEAIMELAEFGVIYLCS